MNNNELGFILEQFKPYQRFTKKALLYTITLSSRYHLCYWNEKVINGKKGISSKGPPPVATVMNSQALFHEFIEKLYQVTSYEKQQTWLTVTCGYPVLKEYITLLIAEK